MKLSRQELSGPRIEMMPLIDIVFLLLVFFIYAFISMAVHRGLAVDLPSAQQVALDTEQQTYAITIQARDDDLAIFVDKEPVALAAVADYLRAKIAATEGAEQREVQIFADKQVPYQGLFKVLDQVRAAGLTHISLQAEQAGDGHE